MKGKTMKIKEVYVEMGVKKSKDFNSCNNAVGLCGLIEPGDDPIIVVQTLQQQCYKLLVKKMFPVPPPAA
jgi:hypothetical protein